MSAERYGPYQVLKRIASGGMGEVFLARREGPEGFEKLVALKRLLPWMRQDAEFVNMFFDEARIAAALEHPNIGQIDDLGDIGGELLLVMEFVHGVSVRDLINASAEKQGAIPLGVCLRIIADVAGALDYAHRATDAKGEPLKLVHRDVSPQNVMVGYDGRVKLIDFGVAKAANKLAKTATGVIRGKIAYMSPEQATDRELDGRSDVFGLGIVAYELLLLRRLFRRETDVATVRAILGGEVRPPSQVEPRLPQALDAIILQALERDRDKRFATAGDFKKAIEKLIAARRVPATPAHVAEYVRGLFPFEAQSPMNVREATRPAASARDEQETASSQEEAHAPDDPDTISTSFSETLSAVFEAGHSLDPRMTSSGLLFKAAAAAAEALGGRPVREKLSPLLADLDGSRRRPTRALLELLERMLAELDKLSIPTTAALEAVGAQLLEALEHTAQGRQLKQNENADSEATWASLVEILQGLSAPGERTLETHRPRFARVALHDEPLPVGVYVGLFRRLLYRLGGFELTAQVQSTKALHYDLVLRW